MYDSSNDGDDNDADGVCDLTDPDDDNDGCNDDIDDDPFTWDDDYDYDGTPDDCDNDDDNDGAADDVDSDDNNEFVCNDDDGDTCDECSSGMYDSSNDGVDNDSDGICNLADHDDDNDGALDEVDSDDNNPYICNDDDGDTCDECSSGTYDSSNDGWDYDADGACDAGDNDDDNDGEIDELDNEDNNEFICHDYDGDLCDECADGSLSPTDDDGVDNDLDGWCNTGDPYPDCAYDNANDPSVYPDQIDVNPYDECGNCHGDGFTDICIGTDECQNMACDGDCDQVAYIDDCGECDDSFNTDCIDFSLSLTSGANLVSFYALPNDVNIASIFSDAEVNYNIMGEGVGAFNLNGMWIGSLSEISQDDGYWIIGSDASTLSIDDADPVSYDSDGEVVYDMHYGANLISYPFQTTQLLEDALGDAIENIFAITSEGVAALSVNGQFVGSLAAFEGGVGYWLIANNDFSFSFNGTENGLARLAEQTPPRLVPIEYQFTQSSQQAFYFIESAYIDGMPLESDDVIIAYNNDVVVGSRYWNGEFTDVPVMGMDLKYNEVTSNYCKEGDKINLKVYDYSSGELIDMDTDNELLWFNMATPIINLSNKLPESVSFNNAYPNPFNPSTNLSFIIPAKANVSIIIYNLKGRAIETLINENLDAGYHSIIWNANNYSSGVYFVKMTSGNFSTTQKLLLVK